MFVKVLIILFLISVVLSFWSLKKEGLKKELMEVKNKLKKGRVIFQSSDSSSPPGKSSSSSS